MENKKENPTASVDAEQEKNLKENDGIYYVVSDKTLVGLLLDAGYKPFHRPYFAMKGCTRKAYTVNTCTKTVVDAAPLAKQPITLQDFLALFENGL